MQCPTCPDSTLVMSDRQGVEIDYCPRCRGVWLDRGELDKLLERSAVVSAEAPVNPAARGHHDFQDSDNRYHRSHGSRRKSWLSDIFD